MTPSVDELLQGLLPGLDPSAESRLPAPVRAKLPVDTVAAARVPAGVHLAFTGSAAMLRLRTRRTEATSAPSPGLADVLEVFVDGDRIRPVALSGGPVVGVVLPQRRAEAVVRIYLPEARPVLIDSVEAVGGDIVPLPRRRRWVVQGDSISQGWSVTAAGLAWPSRLARDLDLDLVNLGFAGSARGEHGAAVAVAQSEADLVTIAWGTNCWSSIPTDAREIAERMRLFLTVVREGLPDIPLTVMSPIVRPAAESEPNCFGATLADLRKALEGAAEEFAAAHGDTNLHVVSGLHLVEAALLVDGVHPGDAGHERLAAVLAEVHGPS